MRRKWQNALQSLLLVSAMAGLLGAVGYIIGGEITVLLAWLSILVLYLLNPSISPRFVLRLYRGQPLQYREAAPLYDLLARLDKRAGLPAMPVLYYLPMPVMNAFAVGQPGHSVIAVSDGLLRRLQLRELAAPLSASGSRAGTVACRAWQRRAAPRQWWRQPCTQTLPGLACWPPNAYFWH